MNNSKIVAQLLQVAAEAWEKYEWSGDHDDLIFYNTIAAAAHAVEAGRIAPGEAERLVQEFEDLL